MRCFSWAAGLFVGLALLAAPRSVGAAIVVPAELQPGSQYHLAFVSSFLSNIISGTAPGADYPNFGGLSAADWNVTFAAWDAGLPGVPANWDGSSTHWKAILSTTGDEAYNRILVNGPIYNMALQRIANDKNDLWDGSLAAPIQYTETGALVISNLQVWTGTSASGAHGGNSADGWTSQLGLGDVGDASASNSAWVGVSIRSANLSARLYGVSPTLTVESITPDNTTTVGERPTSDLADVGGAALAADYVFLSGQSTSPPATGSMPV